MTRWWRATIRVRLALLYAGAFFAAAALFIAFTYVYLGRSLDQHLTTGIGATEQLVFDRASNHTGRLHEAIEAQFEQNRDETMGTMRTWSLAATGGIGVIAGGLGWLLAGRALRPLRKITATARRVADDSNLHERITLNGPEDEIKELADTFNAMLARLDRAFDGQRRFVANASHELRTPLTINRTLIQVALDAPDLPESTRRLGTTLLEVNQRHERLIDGLLVLASSDQALAEQQPVDLADTARHVTALATGIEIRTSLSAAPVLGDPVLLERLTHNLLDNAIRYNIPEGGWVAVTTGTTDGHACLTVENTGPAVPGDEIDGLFEPFRRLASADRLTDPHSASS
ncbi:MAG: HAMP domain-containing protein, partial [Actinomycetota bacterium]|nr:HAMP domain-containing protein [Actinomycetota bacterium]